MKSQAMKRQGFTIVLVLAILALVGVALVVLADITDTLALESQRAYTNACQRNLTASGALWLAHNSEKTSKEALVKGIDLDAKDLHGTSLRVSQTADGQPRITAECRSGRLAVLSPR